MRVKMMIKTNPCNYEMDRWMTENPLQLSHYVSSFETDIQIDENEEEVHEDLPLLKDKSRKLRQRRDGLEKKAVKRLSDLDKRQSGTLGDLTRQTKSGATLNRRKNDGAKAYYKGKKLWDKSVRRERFEEPMGEDVEIAVEIDATQNTPQNDNPHYDADAICAKLYDQPDPQIYVVEYQFDYYANRVYCTTLGAVQNELKSHIISEEEWSVDVIGLYPADVYRLEEYVMCHVVAD